MNIDKFASAVSDDNQWIEFASPVHPRYFLKISATLLTGAFILFATLLV